MVALVAQLTRFLVRSAALLLVPFLSGAALTNAAPETLEEARIAGWEILNSISPDRAEDVTGTRMAEAISNEDPLTLRFAGLELGDDRFLICEADAFGGVDFSVWSINARSFERLAQAEDIHGRHVEIHRACGQALEKIEALS